MDIKLFISSAFFLSIIIGSFSARCIFLVSKKFLNSAPETRLFFSILSSMVVGLGFWASSLVLVLSHEYQEPTGLSFSYLGLSILIALFIVGLLAVPRVNSVAKLYVIASLCTVLYLALNVFNAMTIIPVGIESFELVKFAVGIALAYASFHLLGYSFFNVEFLINNRTGASIGVAILLGFSSVFLTSSIVFAPHTIYAWEKLQNVNISDAWVTLSIVIIVVLSSFSAFLLSSGNPRTNLSLKISSLIGLSLVVAIVSIGATLYRIVENIKTDEYISLSNHVSRYNFDYFRQLNSKLLDELLLMSQHKDVVSFMAKLENSSQHKLDVISLLKRHMYSNDALIQIRLVAGPDSGKELIRVQRFSNEIFLFADSDLQYRGDAEFFREGIKKKAGEVYITKIGLNREGNKIQVPYMPTYRITTPVFNNSKPVGLLVFNVDFKKIINYSYLTKENSIDRYVINENGDFLVHPDSKVEFAFEFSDPIRLQTLVPEIAGIMKSDVVEIEPKFVETPHGRVLYMAYKAYFLPGNNERWLGFISVVDNFVMEKAKSTLIVNFIQVVSIFFLIAISIVAALSRYIVSPLARLSSAYKSFIVDRKIELLESGQDDEIGDLTKSFIELCGDVEKKEAQLLEKTEFLNTILHNTYDGIIVINESGIVQTMNKAAEKMFLRKKEDVIGRNVSELLPEPHREHHDQYIRNYLRTGHGKIIGSGREVTAFRMDNKKIDIELGITELFQGNQRFFVGTLKDITQRKLAEEELKTRQYELSAILEAAVDAILTLNDEGKIIAANPATLKMLGCAKQELIGIEIRRFIPDLPETFYGAQNSAIGGSSIELMAQKRNGSTFPVELSVSETEVDGKHLFTWIMRDISERKKQEDELRTALELLQESKQQLLKSNRELENASKADPLTQISNRRHFEEVFDHEFRRAHRNRSSIGLMMIDVDHFKEYNDRYGHQQGDDCLKSVARVIRETLKRPADLAARYGGEEFVVLMPETDKAGLIIVAENILHTVRALSLPHEGSLVASIVTISVGAYLASPEQDSNRADVVKHADFALYEAKARGRNQVVFKELTGEATFVVQRPSDDKLRG